MGDVGKGCAEPFGSKFEFRNVKGNLLWWNSTSSEVLIPSVVFGRAGTPAMPEQNLCGMVVRKNLACWIFTFSERVIPVSVGRRVAAEFLTSPDHGGATCSVKVKYRAPQGDRWQRRWQSSAVASKVSPSPLQAAKHFPGSRTFTANKENPRHGSHPGDGDAHLAAAFARFGLLARPQISFPTLFPQLSHSVQEEKFGNGFGSGPRGHTRGALPQTAAEYCLARHRNNDPT